MQQLVPTEDNDIYKDPSVNDWFSSYTDQVYPVADNIIALVVRPLDPESLPQDLTTDYRYDSREGAEANPQPVTANQLPPLIQLTMVAIDEATAMRLTPDNSPPSAITAALSGKFVDPSRYDTDLASLEDALIADNIHYRVFTSTLPLRESKWTK